MLKPLIDLPAVSAPPYSASVSGGAHLREIAQRIRNAARECRFPRARREMLDLAASFDRRANYFDSRDAFDSRETAFQHTFGSACSNGSKPT
ncbi:MAG TPA: hypothetical protein VFQ82_16260 [Stellaceae bacterium]|jgi:hypothetical protein|nr:hypothetical protein [Stellaceae bacterium]